MQRSINEKITITYSALTILHFSLVKLGHIIIFGTSFFHLLFLDFCLLWKQFSIKSNWFLLSLIFCCFQFSIYICICVCVWIDVDLSIYIHLDTPYIHHRGWSDQLFFLLFKKNELFIFGYAGCLLLRGLFSSGAWASYCRGFSCCRVQALGLVGFNSVAPSSRAQTQ